MPAPLFLFLLLFLLSAFFQAFFSIHLACLLQTRVVISFLWLTSIHTTRHLFFPFSSDPHSQNLVLTFSCAVYSNLLFTYRAVPPKSLHASSTSARFFFLHSAPTMPRPRRNNKKYINLTKGKVQEIYLTAAAAFGQMMRTVCEHEVSDDSNRPECTS